MFNGRAKSRHEGQPFNSRTKIRLILSLGVAQTVAWGSSYYLPAVLAVPMAQELGCSTSLVYAAFSLALILSALAAPFAGKYIDRWGGSKILVGSSLWFAASLFFLAHVQGEITLFLAWASLGLAMGAGLYDMAFATVVRSHGANAAPIIAGITLLAGFASTISWPVTHFFLESFGWREAFLAWACIHLVLGLPLNFSLSLPLFSAFEKEQTSQAALNTAKVSSKKPLKESLVLYLLIISFVCVSFCSTAMASHMPTLLQLYGATSSVSLIAGMLLGPAQVVARILQLTLLRSLKPISTAFLAALIIPLGVFLLLLFGAEAALAVGLFHGFGNGIMTIVKGTLPLSLFGREGYGQRQGWIFLPAGIVQACSPLLFSLCISSLEKNSLYVYIFFSLMAALLFLCMWIISKK